MSYMPTSAGSSDGGSAQGGAALHWLQAVVEHTPDFVYVFGLDNRLLYANDALLQMWGVARDAAIGQDFLGLGYEPWHARMHQREIDQVRSTREPVRGEVAFSGAHGRRQYDYIFVPILGADGAVEAVGGTTRDITDRREMEDRHAFRASLADALRPLSDPLEEIGRAHV